MTSLAFIINNMILMIMIMMFVMICDYDVIFVTVIIKFITLPLPTMNTVYALRLTLYGCKNKTAVWC